MTIRQLLHPDADPYEDFEPRPQMLYGWNSTAPNFKHVINETQPDLIIEVGSWLGRSAIHMASLCDAHIVCVDTWLGQHYFWSNDRYRDDLALVHGYPSVYFQFLSNIVHAKLQERITPLPLPSQNGAGRLSALGITSKLIYIDASHKYEDVVQDINAYWPLVESGGILFGDDWSVYADVNRAVEEFAAVHRVKIEVRDHQWNIRKP